MNTEETPIRTVNQLLLDGMMVWNRTNELQKVAKTSVHICITWAMRISLNLTLSGRSGSGEENCELCALKVNMEATFKRIKKFKVQIITKLQKSEHESKLGSGLIRISTETLRSTGLVYTSLFQAERCAIELWSELNIQRNHKNSTISTYLIGPYDIWLVIEHIWPIGL